MFAIITTEREGHFTAAGFGSCAFLRRFIFLSFNLSVNIAFPGAGIGSVIDGGSDSCSKVYPSQIDDIERYADPTTWNVVVVTAGIAITMAIKAGRA